MNNKVQEIKNKWINPIGGLGDILMLSGVLKQHYDENPQEKFNLVRRTQYTQVLNEHPAIEKIGYPETDDELIGTNYWNIEKIGGGKQRAYQILARTFGLKTPISEELYLPNREHNKNILFNNIPWKKKNIILAPYSNSPRKTMHPIHWHQLVEKITNNDDILVIQTGLIHEMHIKNTFSLLGVTDLYDLVELVKKADLVISSDSLMMHVAKLTETPGIIIWGPTSQEVYGYENHTHFTAPMDHCNLKDKCLGADFPENYPTQCPLNDSGHCMNRLDVNKLYNATIETLN